MSLPPWLISPRLLFRQHDPFANLRRYLVDKTGQNDLAQLRSFQDWYLRYWLQSVPGVAEVNSIGGHAHRPSLRARK